VRSSPIPNERLLLGQCDRLLLAGLGQDASRPVAVARHRDRQWPLFGLEGLPALAVARVAGTVAGGIVFGVAQVVGQLGVERTLDNSLGQLLQQALLTQDVFGFLVVLEQLIEQLGGLDVVLDVHGSGPCGVSPLGYGEEQ
jgi:hypothetical protein